MNSIYSFFSNRLILVWSIMVLFVYLFRMIYLYYLPIEELVKYVPDDAFYYLVLSNNFSEHNWWTFDLLNNASGFHFLFGYFLVFVNYFIDSLEFHKLFFTVSLVNIVAVSVSFYFLSKLVIEKFNNLSIFGLLIVFLSPISIYNTTFMMESSFVILLSSLLIYYTYTSENIKHRNLLLFLFGLFGELSRTDFGAIPLVLMLVSIAYMYYINKKIKIEKENLYSLCGAITGLAIVLLHNYIIFDQLFQSSALMKSYWSTVHGFSIKPALFTFISNSIFDIKFFVLLIITIFIFNYKNFFELFKDKIFTSAFLILSFYIVFYGKNSGALQPWYIANIHIVMSLLSVYFFSIIKQKKLTYFVISISLFFFAYSIHLSIKPKWYNQEIMYETGIFLKNNKEYQLVGSWNAGITNYFSESNNVVNLDGLVNDSIYSFAKKGQLYEYIKDNNINYIVDTEEMLTNPILSKRGGYNDGRLFKCMEKIKVFKNKNNNTSNNWGNDWYLYKIKNDENCK